MPTLWYSILRAKQLRRVFIPYVRRFLSNLLPLTTQFQLMRLGKQEMAQVVSSSMNMAEP